MSLYRDGGRDAGSRLWWPVKDRFPLRWDITIVQELQCGIGIA
jgi:hypothetical protein